MARIAIALVWIIATFASADRVTAQQRAAESTAPALSDEDTPLPPGALARLGRTRWRHGDAIIGSVLSADGHCVHGVDRCVGFADRQGTLPVTYPNREGTCGFQ